MWSDVHWLPLCAELHGGCREREGGCGAGAACRGQGTVNSGGVLEEILGAQSRGSRVRRLWTKVGRMGGNVRTARSPGRSQ